MYHRKYSIPKTQLIGWVVSLLGAKQHHMLWEILSVENSLIEPSHYRLSCTYNPWSVQDSWMTYCMFNFQTQVSRSSYY